MPQDQRIDSFFIHVQDFIRRFYQDNVHIHNICMWLCENISRRPMQHEWYSEPWNININDLLNTHIVIEEVHHSIFSSLVLSLHNFIMEFLIHSQYEALCHVHSGHDAVLWTSCCNQGSGNKLFMSMQLSWNCSLTSQ